MTYPKKTKKTHKLRTFMIILIILIILSSLFGGYFIYLYVKKFDYDLRSIFASPELKTSNLTNENTFEHNESTRFISTDKLINTLTTVPETTIVYHHSKNYSKIHQLDLKREISSLLMLKNGDLVVSLKLDKIIILDLQTNSEKNTLDSSRQNVLAMVELESQDQIAFVSQNKILFCDLNKEKANIMFDEHNKPLYSLMNLNMNKLVSGSNGQIVIWDLNIKENTDKQVFDRGIGNLRIEIIKKLKDDRYLTLAGFGSKILIWDLKLNQVKHNLQEHFKQVNALEELNNETLASGHDDGTILVWNIQTRSHKYTLNIPTNHYAVNSLKLLSNNYLAAGYHDGSIVIWDLNTNSIKWELREHQGTLMYLDELSNGNILSVSTDGKIIQWTYR